MINIFHYDLEPPENETNRDAEHHTIQVDFDKKLSQYIQENGLQVFNSQICILITFNNTLKAFFPITSFLVL